MVGTESSDLSDTPVLARALLVSVVTSATDVDGGETVAVGEQAVRPRAVTRARARAAVALPDRAPINACPTTGRVHVVGGRTIVALPPDHKDVLHSLRRISRIESAVGSHSPLATLNAA